MWLVDIFKVNALKKEILQFKKGVKSIVSAVCDEKIFVEWYGAYDIDPKHLVFWICIQTDRMKAKMKNDKVLNQKLRQLLEIHNYPNDARDYVVIDFESQETVDRESNGNWHIHFK